jgi:hypothetical protein
VHRELLDFDGLLRELVEQAPQRLDATVAGDLQAERGLVPGGSRERARRRLELGRVRELQPDVTARYQSLQLRGGSLRYQPAPVQHGDPVRKTVGLVEVLRREEDGDAVPDQFADRLPHRPAAARVQARGGLIEEDDLGTADQGHREVEPAPHPAGQGRRGLVRGFGQVEPLDELVHASPPPCAAQMVQVGH